MQKTMKAGVAVLAVGAALGLCGVLLFSAAGAGLNVALYAALSAGAAVFMRARVGASPVTADVLPLALIVLFALTFVWRDAAVLHVLAGAAMLLGFLHLHLRHGAKRLVDCGPYAAFVELARASVRLPRAAPALIRHDIPWRELNGGHAGTLRALGRGIAGLLPIAFLFGSLLASADARFESYTAVLFDWDIATLIRRGLIFWVCLSLAVALITTYIRYGPADAREIRRAAWQTGAIEVTTVLAGLNLLFISYIVVQGSYFFGDQALIRDSHAFSYSSYARRGFFELVWLSVLLLPTLLISGWLLRDASSSARYAFRILAGGLVAAVLVIVASAMHRMHLYVEAYGLTELRFYAAAFMLWLSVVYAWYCVTNIVAGTGRFADGTVTTALVVVAALVIVNPGAVIARTNLDRLAAMNRLDGDYLVALGSDAVPVLLGTSASGGPVDDDIIKKLTRRHVARERKDWRAWNLSRARARNLLRERIAGGE